MEGHELRWFGASWLFARVVVNLSSSFSSLSPSCFSPSSSFLFQFLKFSNLIAEKRKRRAEQKGIVER